MKVSQGMHDWWLIITKGVCVWMGWWVGWGRVSWPIKINTTQIKQLANLCQKHTHLLVSTHTQTQSMLGGLFAFVFVYEMQHVIHCPSSASVTALLCNTMAHINAGVSSKGWSVLWGAGGRALSLSENRKASSSETSPKSCLKNVPHKKPTQKLSNISQKLKDVSWKRLI